MFTTREFVTSDIDGVIRLITTVVKEILNCHKSDLKKLVTDLSDIKGNYVDKGGVFFVGENDGKIIGTIALLPETKKTAKLKRMYIDKTSRGQGLGSKLFDCAENWCRERGYTKIVLSTYPPFTGKTFYEKKGFIKYKSIGKKTYYQKPIG